MVTDSLFLVDDIRDLTLECLHMFHQCECA